MTEILEFLRQSAERYWMFSALLFICVRALSIIVPPIPGIPLDLLGISVYGRWVAFVLAESGMMLGATIAFLIARYSSPWIPRLASIQKILKWEKKLKSSDRFWAFLTIRLFTTFGFGYISYAAGFTSMRLGPFLIATLLGSIPSMAGFYWLAGTVPGWALVLIAFVSGSIIIAGRLLLTVRERWWRRIS